MKEYQNKMGANDFERVELFGSAKIDGSNLPQAPKSAFRKRPVRLSYDKNEFYTFRMPSERDFFLSSFDKNDLFGKRHGLQHSPHIQSQMTLDTRLLLGLVLMTFAMITTDFKKNDKNLNLRENFRAVGDIKNLKASDFIEKQ